MDSEQTALLGRQQALSLLSGQGVVLLIISFTWVFFDPAIPLFASIYWNTSHMLWGIVCGLSLCLFSGLMIWSYADLCKAVIVLDRAIFQGLKPSDAFYLALISGVSEEIFFRGILLNKFGIVAASIIFGLMHVAGRRMLPYGLWATCAGFYMGYLYLYTGNLLAVIMAHVLNNGIALLLWLRYRSYFIARNKAPTQ